MKKFYVVREFDFDSDPTDVAAFVDREDALRYVRRKIGPRRDDYAITICHPNYDMSDVRTCRDVYSLTAKSGRCVFVSDLGYGIDEISVS